MFIIEGTQCDLSLASSFVPHVYAYTYTHSQRETDAPVRCDCDAISQNRTHYTQLGIPHSQPPNLPTSLQCGTHLSGAIQSVYKAHPLRVIPAFSPRIDIAPQPLLSLPLCPINPISLLSLATSHCIVYSLIDISLSNLR